MHDRPNEHAYTHGFITMFGVFVSLLITLFAVSFLLLHYTTPRIAYGGGVIAVLVHSKVLLLRMGY